VPRGTNKAEAKLTKTPRFKDEAEAVKIAPPGEALTRGATSLQRIQFLCMIVVSLRVCLSVCLQADRKFWTNSAKCSLVWTVETIRETLATFVSDPDLTAAHA